MTRKISALEVRFMTSALNPKRDVQRMVAISNRKPANVAAVKALGAGIFCSKWRVGLGCCEALGNTDVEPEQAANLLLSAFSHRESSVRSGAAKALKSLAEKTSVSSKKLWQNLKNETEALTAFDITQALAKSMPGDSTEQTTFDVLSVLKTWFGRGRGYLPLGSDVGAASSDEVFRLADDGSFDDIYGIACGLMGVLNGAKGYEGERFRFFLKYLNAEYSCRHYANFRLNGLLAVCSTEEQKIEILETASSGQRRAQGHPNLPLLRARPQWVAEILQRHIERDNNIDWTNWVYFLEKVPSEHLGRISEVFKKLDDEKKLVLLKLLEKVHLGPLLPGIEACLQANSEDLLRLTLRRLVSFQQPVPQLLTTLLSLKERLGSTELLELCDEIMGQSGGVPGGDAEVPRGKEPCLQVEIQLNETYKTPFGPEQKPWKESLVRCRVHYTKGQLLFRTPDGLICFIIEEGSVSAPVRIDFAKVLPLNASPPYFSLTGESGDVFLSDRGPNRERYYLFSSGKLRKLEPEIDSDHTPRQEELQIKGENYGWAKRAWIMSHFEADPGHHEEVAYTIDTSKARIKDGLSGSNWRSVESAHLEATFGTSVFDKGPRAKFRYAPQGGYRVLDSQGLLVRLTGENPFDSTVATNDSATLLVDVFGDGRLRVSLWEPEP